MRGAVKYGIIAGVVLVVIIAFIVWATVGGWLLNLLYVFLILLATLLLAATFLQIYWVIKLIRTITVAREEIQPLLAEVQNTVGVVKDTAQTAGRTVSAVGAVTRLTSEFALGPSVRIVAGLVAGLQVLRVLLGKGQIRSRAEQRRRQQMEAGAGGD